MNKKIIIISIIVAILVGIGVVVLVKNTNTDESNTNISQNKKNQENEVKDGKFSFIYNYNDLTEEWWNTLNDEWKDYGFTNIKVLENRTEKALGNLTGKLSVRPVDFIEYLKIGYESIMIKDEYYSLEIKNNTFLIPNQIKIIDDNINNVSAELRFYILGSDLFPYEISLMVDDNPRDIELINNEWKIVSTSNNGTIGYDAYYPVNTDYCLHLTFPYAYLEEGLKDLDERTREYYKTKRPYDEKDLEELVNKTVKVFALSKLNGTTVDKLSLNVKLNDIQLDNNTTVHMNNTKMISWHSGTGNVVGKIFEKDSVITAYNSNNEMVYVTEYSSDKSVDSLFSYLNLSKKEYNYNGRDMYIVYYNDEATEMFRGKYYGILFKIGDIWYEVNGSKTVEPTIDVNSWIKNMCSGVITFK